jgi:hypothetical protein
MRQGLASERWTGGTTNVPSRATRSRGLRLPITARRRDTRFFDASQRLCVWDGLVVKASRPGIPQIAGQAHSAITIPLTDTQRESARAED